MKSEYIEKIKEQLQASEDVALLDFIYQLLKKAGATT